MSTLRNLPTFFKLAWLTAFVGALLVVVGYRGVRGMDQLNTMLNTLYERDMVGVIAADESWHGRHEDVVDALAQLRSPASVEVLSRLALAPRLGLDGDEAQALGARCVLALGAVQNRAALLRLGQIVQCGARGVAAKAEAQLERLEGGWGRSRGVRGMARLVLDSSRAARAGADLIGPSRVPRS